MKNTIGVVAIILMFMFVMYNIASYVNDIERRLSALERESSKIIEIVVERSYDDDMGVYDYKLIAVKE